MAVRHVYSCDWCQVDAKAAGSIDGDWKTPVDPNGMKLHLCGSCFKALADMWNKLTDERTKLRPSHSL